jgi:hypothetical protein
MPSQLREDLNALAAVRGVSHPELMRQLLSTAVEEHRPQIQALRKIQGKPGRAA